MRPLSNLSVRSKLVLLIAFASCLAALSVLLGVLAYENTGFRPRALQQLRQNADLVDNVLGWALEFNDQDASGNTLDVFSAFPGIKLAALYDASGNPFGQPYRGSGPAVALPATAPPDGEHHGLNHVTITWPVINAGETNGHLYVMEVFPPLHRRLPQYGIMAGAVFLALGIVAAVLLQGVERTILGPLSELERTTARVIEQEDYHVRARIRRPDELGRLGKAFNKMLEVIGQRDVAIRDAGQRIQKLIENATDLITVFDLDGNILFQSPSSERVLGLQASELVGKNLKSLVHPEDLPRAAATLQRALHAFVTPNSHRFRIRHTDGSWRLIEAAGRPIDWESGQSRAVVVNARDVTEASRLEDQLRQSQKMEAIGQLSGGVAHDFNNILTVISGHIDILASHPRLPSELNESVQEIKDSAHRAANLTRQLLAFSRRQTMQPRNLELNEVVSNMTRMLQRILGEDIQMRLHFAPQAVRIWGDASMLEQVLLNLAVNSRDAMPGGGRLVIETAVVELDTDASKHHPDARPGHFARLSVTDTGSGMSADVLQRIFEPFFTTKEVGKGTGLGLATAYGIVHQHQGWISVYSEPGQGSTFRIFLPVPEPGPTDPEVNRKPSKPSFADLPRGQEVVLFVEDEASLRKLGRNILDRLGYQVIEAPTGVAGLESWRQHRDEIRILVTDLVMPGGMSGRDLAQALHQEAPHLPVVFMSGYSADIAGKDFPLEEGVNFLPKPFEPVSLAHVVRASLDAAQGFPTSLPDTPADSPPSKDGAPSERC
jgi:PAS domain S-box-containing protein